MNFTEGLKATGSIVQETPQSFFDWLNGIFRFDLDVCALPENAKCEKYYTPEMDGLKNDWVGGGMVQPSIWKRHHQLGQKGFGRDTQRLLQVYRHALTGKNRYKMVSTVCVRKGISVLYQWPFVIWQSKGKCSVSKCSGGVCGE